MKRQLIGALFLLIACLPIRAMAGQCRIADYAHEIECGTFEVKNPITGKSENIAWHRIEARARYPYPDPVIWIPGGLGIDATDRAPGVINMLSRLQNSRDLIWIDIHGSGKSSPLSCAKPARSKIKERIDIFSNPQVLQSCHDEIAVRGGAQVYNFQHLAHHYEQLRQHLKLGKVNVIADGLGGNIALAWHKLAPGVMRGLVLDSPPSLEEIPAISRAKSYASALENIVTACLQDKDCQKYHPDMESYLGLIKAKLPREIVLVNPQTGIKETLNMDEQMFSQLLMGILRTPARATALPNVLHAASTGDWQPMIGLGAMSWSKLNTRFSHGLWLASLCANGREQPDIKLQGDADWFYQMQKNRINLLCRGKWGGEAQYTIPEKTPVLIFVPLADPFAGHKFASTENVKVIQVPGASSGVISIGCARDIVYRFITDKGLPQDDKGLACLTDFPLPVVGPINKFGRTP
ncbi:MAG TPA: alpha/beta fold hydrolase [Methylophilus sp.]|nr:alpha/beta fold hydrolase [Methylophilus sp.]HQQ32946.1 alpha/beta fold hydrolase [Methylophilus sp.]